MSDDARPEAFLQWKGTNACLDLYCTCGDQFHFDGHFASELTCGRCGQTWELPHMLALRAVDPSRQMKLIYDGDWEGAPEDGYVREGGFTVPWPRPVFAGVEPGGTFEIHDDVQGRFTRSVYVKLVSVTPAPDGTMILTVQNTGLVP